MDNDMSVMQEINGNDGQIAGRDINNYYGHNYWLWFTEDLVLEREKCRRKLRYAQRKLLLAPGMLAVLTIAIFIAGAVISGKLFAAPKEVIAGVFFLGIIGAAMFPTANKKYGKLISLQINNIEEIDLVLMDRSLEH